MFKSIFKSTNLQPILTVVLVSTLAVLVFQFVGNKSSNNEDTALKEVARKVTFEEASEKFFTKSYQIYTRGSLLVKNKTAQPDLLQNSSSTTPTPVISPTNTTKVTESMYTDLFFFSQNGKIKRIDTNTYGQSDARFFNEAGDLVLVNNTNKVYRVVEKNVSDNSEDNKVLVESAVQLFNEFFPLVPLLSEYEEGKFNPVERAYNVYSGKWQHPFFTSGEVVDIFLETDPTSGSFRSITVIHEFSDVQSTIFFDFKEREITPELFKTPETYTKI